MEYTICNQKFMFHFDPINTLYEVTTVLNGVKYEGETDLSPMSDNSPKNLNILMKIISEEKHEITSTDDKLILSISIPSIEDKMIINFEKTPIDSTKAIKALRQEIATLKSEIDRISNKMYVNIHLKSDMVNICGNVNAGVDIFKYLVVTKHSDLFYFPNHLNQNQIWREKLNSEEISRDEFCCRFIADMLYKSNECESQYRTNAEMRICAMFAEHNVTINSISYVHNYLIIDIMPSLYNIVKYYYIGKLVEPTTKKVIPIPNDVKLSTLSNDDLNEIQELVRCRFVNSNILIDYNRK